MSEWCSVKLETMLGVIIFNTSAIHRSNFANAGQQKAKGVGDCNIDDDDNQRRWDKENKENNQVHNDEGKVLLLNKI